ncbi:acyltransferase [Lactobacillus crispatus]|uniref:Acyltransferase n=1 Tax=Lactobacillus crispatus TaxID=47770 RepID=A0A7H9EAU2_9LACO|nr:acyltransferase [Lactobacillus crispatus]QLL74726.1 acyltransferase [Lactobacillus crispatus]
MNVKNWIKIKVLGYRATSDSYIAYLRKIGVSIGKGVKIYRPFNTTIDIQAPHLLSIGDYVQITGPATILNHDYSWSVIKRKYGYIYGSQRKTIIGNNVFIGWGATILGGSTIGDNVIIGANSVVSGEVESNSVYAGNPAKKIMTLNEYYEKRRSKQINEAITFVKEYKKRFGEIPPESKLSEYFFLFKPTSLNKKFVDQMKLMENYELSKKKLYENYKFKSYKDFIDYCLNNG